MGEIADEIAPYGFETADPCKILDKQEASTGMLIGDNHKLQILMARGELNGLALQLARLLTASPRFDKLVMTDHFYNTSVGGIRCLKELACSGICKLDDSLRVGDEHTIRHLLEDSGQAGAFGV